MNNIYIYIKEETDIKYNNHKTGTLHFFLLVLQVIGLQTGALAIINIYN